MLLVGFTLSPVAFCTPMYILPVKKRTLVASAVQACIPAIGATKQTCVMLYSLHTILLVFISLQPDGLHLDVLFGGVFWPVKGQLRV